MKIVITGVTGFVGGSLMRYYAGKGHEVLGLGRNPGFSQKIEKFGKFIQADISERVPAIECDLCIHAAGLASDTASYKKLYQANVVGSEKVIDAIKCPNFIFISSSSVYNFTNQPANEHDKIDLNLLHDYGKSKRLAEIALHKQRKFNQSLYILRPRIIYGIGDRLLIPRLVQASRKGIFVSPGNLEVQTSMTHIEHVQTACDICIDSQEIYQVLNIADLETYSLREIIFSLIESYHKKSIRHIKIPVFIANIIADYGAGNGKLNRMAIENLTQSKLLDTTVISGHRYYRNDLNFKAEQARLIAWLKSIPSSKLNTDTSSLSWE